MLTKTAIDTPITEVMTKKVMSVAPTDTMDKVKALFEQWNIHHVVVINDQQEVLGLVSSTDYNRILNSFMLFNKQRNEKLNKATLQAVMVRDIMAKQFAYVYETDSLMKAVDMFRENLFRALPVVDRDKKLKGIITTYDLMIYAYK
ncbi:MAG: CBS domain-containing protein [Bacteroidota bacterium]